MDPDYAAIIAALNNGSGKPRNPMAGRSAALAGAAQALNKPKQPGGVRRPNMAGGGLNPKPPEPAWQQLRDQGIGGQGSAAANRAEVQKLQNQPAQRPSANVGGGIAAGIPGMQRPPGMSVFQAPPGSGGIAAGMPGMQHAGGPPVTMGQMGPIGFTGPSGSGTMPPPGSGGGAPSGQGVALPGFQAGGPPHQMSDPFTVASGMSDPNGPGAVGAARQAFQGAPAPPGMSDVPAISPVDPQAGIGGPSDVDQQAFQRGDSPQMAMPGPSGKFPLNPAGLPTKPFPPGGQQSPGLPSVWGRIAGAGPATPGVRTNAATY